MAKLVTPRNALGLPDPVGAIGFLSIGMSNTQQEFGAFMTMARADASRNSWVHPVNGAAGGWGAPSVAQADSDYWTLVEQKLAAAHLTDAQVQAVWLKEAVPFPTGTFPTDAEILRTYLERIVRILGQRFPNLGLVYISSRIYAGYATTGLNPEPYAYDSGFSVKWLVEDQIKGRLPIVPRSMPWIGWGPYLWADGERPRSDGLVWHCSDLRSDDGTHPSDAGKDKVARKLLQFLHTDETAKTWYVRGGVLGVARSRAHAIPLTRR